MTAVIHPVKHSTRLNGKCSERGSGRVRGLPDPPPTRQGGAGAELEPGLGSEPGSEPTRGGAEEGGGLPERDPPLQYPPTHPVTYGSDGKPPSPCTHTDLHLGSSYVSRVAWFKGRR